MTDSIPLGYRVVVWRKHQMRRPTCKQGFRTICEVLRELHRDARAREDALSMARIAEAYDMAKRMHTRLTHYSEKRIALISTEQGMVWVGQGQLLRLTDAECALINAHREKQSKAS